MRRTLTIALAALAAIACLATAWRYHLVAQMREPVAALLTDPESAQFRNERLFSGWTPGSSALCGEVNARNRMGGYVGFTSFSVVAGLAHIADADETRIKREADIPLCAFETADMPWWHLRW